MNGLFTLTWSNVKSAVIYGLMTMIVTFIYVTGSSILSHGSIYGLDWADIVNKGAIATLGILVSFTSIIKNLLTDSKGNFLGVLEVIPDKTKTEKTDDKPLK